MTETKYHLVEHEKPFKYDENGLHVTRGSAWSGPGCHIGCGVLLYTDDDGKLVKVEGDPENPYNKGRLCNRCLALTEVVYSPDRITSPMKRDPAHRGEDKWEQITWDEALDLVYDRFTEIKEKYGAWSIPFVQGTGRDIAAWITRLAWSFGSPNYMFNMSGMACYLPRVAGCAATTGNFWVGDFSQQYPDRYDNPEWEPAEYIMVWGNNPLIANSDGFYGHWMVDVMKRGSKLIVVDPRLTWLAYKAEYWLQIRPGTDAALALGMLNVIISEDLYDHDFVDRWCYGFDELAQTAAAYPADKVASITWVPEEKIVGAARTWANARCGIVQWGLAVDTTKESLPAAQAIGALWQICGFCEKPGCMIVPPEILAYSGGFGGELVTPEMDAHRIGLDKYSLLKFGFQVASSDEVMKTLETGEPYKLHGAWLQTTNFLTCTSPDPERSMKAWRTLDFIVVVDMFMTPTAMALADVFLPACTYAERDGIRVGDGAQRGETINKVCQVGECKSDMQINLELGRRFNPEAWPWKDDKEMFSYVIECTGYTFEELQQAAPAYIPFEYHRHEKGLLRPDGQPGFNTQTGRIELWSTFYNNAGLSPVPYFEEPTESPESTPDLYEEYPFVLTTGARNWFMFHSEHRQIPHLRAGRPWPIVQINPKAAEKVGVHDGEWVWLENGRGRCKRVVECTEIMDERVIMSDHAWWFPEAPGEEKDGLFGMLDLNVNKLLNSYLPGKSGFGANYKSMLCKVYPVKEGE
ncbi:molybdopterin-dependent oxidoreductase [Gordonibacter massiliensis (ex Traore et al. 2017)]|uniref:Molybdopterin-dependent oxidoreductase n=1 Tax=Gordonibacter massiliensis (ex Traore et al. 2017) TaxID=1841863 RepID=A0A842JC17_9ACTN|nr:molybdopterin-dependent oxidoreductase [Gordonibacter massiliensis (ex Traore et al. 2017)]MBC2889413.1 molybdopterin-dependent oxidoreductase [Gordonibacter massiliensis (ex Traore et al. 2017)]